MEKVVLSSKKWFWFVSWEVLHWRLLGWFSWHYQGRRLRIFIISLLFKMYSTLKAVYLHENFLMFSFLQRMDQERVLTDSQRDKFEDMLRALTLERSQIREAMDFALDNSEVAGEVPH